MLHRFPPGWALRHGFVPDALRPHFVDGIGATMLVDYTSSDCGPYRELLFVPGKFRTLSGQTYYSITRIFVSTRTSVTSGIANWGIPKELAAFDWELDGRLERVTVRQDDMPVAEFAFSSSGGLALPVTTDILPASFRTLVQLENDETVLTAPSGSGNLALARLAQVTVNPALFPDLSEVKPFLTVKAEPFRLGFPVPRRERVTWS